jgi:predicted transcriptional regulator
MEPHGDELWDPASGRFHRARLLWEMTLRLWTADDLAREAGISRTTAYKVIAGEGVLSRTAYKILLALERCKRILSDLL